MGERGGGSPAHARAEHRRLLRAAFSDRGGVEVDTQGDAFLYAFRDPAEALAAAAQGQQALESGPVRVRMGLHTGEPRLTGEGYAGRELHRAARIAASGHGGQVVVSSATRALVDGDLTELGEHRLKDFDEPVALFQLGSERFPPLKTISNTNLPRPVSSFVGREREREQLRIAGEVEYSVSRLAEPEAVELFCDRSRLEPDETVAELCRRLDDLPLAVELAAARTRVLTPSQILDRLGQRLDLLKGGRDADPRQQTLRATIEWSHDLLTGDEKQLFARLAVFTGGCTLDAAEDVCDADVDVLQSLLDKSLLRHTGDRFWMLETIREFAVERLKSRPETDRVLKRHAQWYLGLAKSADRASRGATEREWLVRLGGELENLRSAIDWTRNHDGHLEVELVEASWYFFSPRGLLPEALGYLPHAVQAAGRATPSDQVGRP